jgi:hypothetical protein
VTISNGHGHGHKMRVVMVENVKSLRSLLVVEL